MATTVWQIDPAHSTIEFSVKHMMFTTVRGRFTKFTGTISADEQNPNNSTATVEIDAASIDTGTADRDAHLRSADFLDVQQYPTMTFRSTPMMCASKGSILSPCQTVYPVPTIPGFTRSIG